MLSAKLSTVPWVRKTVFSSTKMTPPTEQQVRNNLYFVHCYAVVCRKHCSVWLHLLCSRSHDHRANENTIKARRGEAMRTRPFSHPNTHSGTRTCTTTHLHIPHTQTQKIKISGTSALTSIENEQKLKVRTKYVSLSSILWVTIFSTL